MDNINLKAARKFLKQEIATLKQEIIVNKTQFRQAQSLVGKLFFQKNLNPYQWYLTNGIINKNYKETDEAFKLRCDTWTEYKKLSPYKCDFLPLYTYDTGEKETITCLHVLYNHLRNTKKHTKDDSRYAVNQIYKDMLQRLEVLFPILPEVNEKTPESSGTGIGV